MLENKHIWLTGLYFIQLFSMLDGGIINYHFPKRVLITGAYFLVLFEGALN